jgi:hypothetical protein
VGTGVLLFNFSFCNFGQLSSTYGKKEFDLVDAIGGFDRAAAQLGLSLSLPPPHS